MKNLYLILCLLFAAGAAQSQLKLSSYPSARATIYLDFDGEYVDSYVWNGGTPFTCAPAALTDAQITTVFNRVAEDYRPFNINITTDINVFLAAPLSQRIRVIVTPTSSWFAGVGGVAYLGSFIWGDDTPCFVFSDRLNNSPKMVAECCSHESGHALGLTHQSRYDNTCNLTATYNDGTGSGQAAWAPIMGNSYYRNMSGWNNGPTPYGCGFIQDNLTIITTRNGFSYRTDDYADVLDDAVEVDATEMHIDGVISTSTDKDIFRFTLQEGSNILIEAAPFSVGANNEGANLDVKLSFFNEQKELIGAYSPDNSMSVLVDTILTQGTYFMMLEGTGNSHTSDYGSLGSYNIKGLAKILPIRRVMLSGTQQGGRHHLQWDIITDVAVKTIVIEASYDGIVFSKLYAGAGGLKSFLNTASQNNTIYYRLKATAVTGQSVYSNTVLLKPGNNLSDPYSVSTFVTHEILVRATEKYAYQLADASGVVYASGHGVAGITRLNMLGRPAGLYVLQLSGKNGRITQRIVKQ
ncbi:MAG TPA: T9SS type A sorting domain-containing protein [Ferruginibacter sp.]|nr:T9SS type A sorting domain-containing protein [Ferruginibacter sp.]HMP20812.1 T9SS type A sorting domain-containing protein [Ferruginibacter sp.]